MVMERDYPRKLEFVADGQGGFGGVGEVVPANRSS